MEPVRFAKGVRLLGGVAVVAVLALAASACGGSSSSDTTTTTGATATVVWANGVCNSFAAWKGSLQRARADLGDDNPSSSDVQNAGHQAQVATQALATSLQTLGPPPTGNTATVQQSIATLRTQLQSGRQKINNTLNGSFTSPAEVKAGAASVQASASQMLDDFTTAVNGLKSLDPGSEVEKAFHQAAACEPFFT